jgi:hypothetical protein
MKKEIETRTIEVPVVIFEDGTKIDLTIISKFIHELDDEDFEKTVGCSDDYTDDYFYFEDKEEKKLEPILLKYNIIRKSTYHKEWNKKVEEGSKHYTYYLYWLSDGYMAFKDMYYSFL